MKIRFMSLLATAAMVGCGSAPEPPTVTPLKVTPVAYTDAGDPVVEFEAPVMHCEACAATIVSALKEKKSVIDASANPETKIVSVTFSQQGFNPKASIAAAEAVAAIADAGFGEATPVDEVAPVKEVAPLEAEKPADDAKPQ
jgi:copper chaperone CopZ